MRIIKKEKIALLNTWFCILYCIPILLFLFAQSHLHVIPSINYFFLFVSLYICISPIGRIHLTPKKNFPSYNFFHWFGLIIAIELGVACLFYSMIHTSITYIHNSTALNISKQMSLYSLNFSLVAMLSAVLAYLYYYKNNSPTLSSLINFGKTSDDKIRFKRIFSICFIANNLLMIALTVCFGALAISQLISHLLKIQTVYLMQASSVFWFSGILLALNSKQARAIISFLCGKSISLGIFFLAEIFLIAISLIIVNLVTPYFNALLTAAHGTIFYLPFMPTSPAAINYVCWLWWMGWGLFISTLIVRISGGRKIWEMILGILAFPMVLLIVSKLFSFPTFSSNLMTDMLAVLGPLLILLLYVRSLDSNYLIYGFLPIDTDETTIHSRRVIKFLHPFLQGIVITTAFYLFFGMNALVFSLTMAVIPCVILFVGIGLSFIFKLT